MKKGAGESPAGVKGVSLVLISLFSLLKGLGDENYKTNNIASENPLFYILLKRTWYKKRRLVGIIIEGD
jgi:hypothetical protein